MLLTAAGDAPLSAATCPRTAAPAAATVAASVAVGSCSAATGGGARGAERSVDAAAVPGAATAALGDELTVSAG